MTVPVNPAVQPAPYLGPTHDAKDQAIWTRLRLRFFTMSGNQVNLPVTATDTTKAVVFPREEVDTEYGLSVTTNWDTTWWWTGKSTTGVTLNFSTPAPADAFVDVAAFRSED